MLGVHSLVLYEIDPDALIGISRDCHWAFIGTIKSENKGDYESNHDGNQDRNKVMHGLILHAEQKQEDDVNDGGGNQSRPHNGWKVIF